MTLESTMLRSSHSTYHYWVLTILLVALVLRLPHLSGSFWLDEAAQALESTRPLSQQLEIAEDFQPPLLHLILHFASQVSHSEWWLRTIGALIPGLITIWATIQIGTRLHHPKTGLLAGVLLATSPFHIFYSQELRPYSLPAMLAVLSWLTLFSWPQPSRWQPSIWKPFPTQWLLVSYLLLSALGFYSSYLYPFVVIGQVVYLWWFHRTQFLAWGSAIVGAVVLFLPWLPSLLEQLRVGSELRSSLPGWETVVSFTQIKALPLVGAKFIFGIAPLSLTPYLVLMTLVLVGASIALGWLTLHRRNLQSSTVSFLIWIVVPLFFAWVVSFFVPVIQPKRVLFILPACYLLLGSFTARYLRITLQPNPSLPLFTHLAAVIVVASLMTVNIAGTHAYYTQEALQRENWRGVFNQVLKQFPADKTVVVFSFPQAFAPWRWYESELQRELQREVALKPLRANQPLTHPIPAVFATGTLQATEAQDLELRLAELSTQYEYILVFDYLRDLTDPTNKLPETLVALGLENTGMLEYPNIGFVRIYEHRP